VSEFNPIVSVEPVLLERARRMTDTAQFDCDVGGRRNIAVRYMTEIELFTGLIAPIGLVNRAGSLAMVHGRGIVPRGAEMSSIVRRNGDPLDSAALAVGQVLGLQAWEETEYFEQHLVVAETGD